MSANVTRMKGHLTRHHNPLNPQSASDCDGEPVIEPLSADGLPEVPESPVTDSDSSPRPKVRKLFQPVSRSDHEMMPLGRTTLDAFFDRPFTGSEQKTAQQFQALACVMGMFSYKSQQAGYFESFLNALRKDYIPLSEHKLH